LNREDSENGGFDVKGFKMFYKITAF